MMMIHRLELGYRDAIYSYHLPRIFKLKKCEWRSIGSAFQIYEGDFSIFVKDIFDITSLHIRW